MTGMAAGADFDLAEVGRALVTVAMTSRLLGHASLAGTVRDYLVSREEGRTAEQQFVAAILLGGNPVTDEMAIKMLQGIALPQLEADR